jgi:hypothetical protein
MRKTLTNNQLFTITTKSNIVNIALISGSILYKIGSEITGANDERAYTLNEDLRTDSIHTGNVQSKTVYIRAGANGAVFQFRGE